MAAYVLVLRPREDSLPGWIAEAMEERQALEYARKLHESTLGNVWVMEASAIARFGPLDQGKVPPPTEGKEE